MSDFEFFGERYGLRDAADCEVAMLDFAEVASDVDETSALDSLRVLKQFLREVVVEEDWARFWKSARKNRAQVSRDLMPIVVRVFSVQTDRPTGRPSDSSDGPTGTPESSEPVSSSPDVPSEPTKLRAVERLERQGRPDKALIVQMAVDARESAVSA